MKGLIFPKECSVQCMSVCVCVCEQRGVVAAPSSCIPCLIYFAFVRGRYLDSGPFVSSCLSAMSHAKIRMKIYSRSYQAVFKPCAE